MLYREPSIDASYQVSVHLAKGFQRTRFLETNQLETRIVYGTEQTACCARKDRKSGAQNARLGIERDTNTPRILVALSIITPSPINNLHCLNMIPSKKDITH
jgi:hypothetical protein